MRIAKVTKERDGSTRAWYRIADLTLDPKNARRHDDIDIEGIAKSLDEFEQQTPIVIDADGIVRKGNGTCLALLSRGEKLVWGVRTKLRGAEAVAYALADNRTGELSTWDIQIVAETLRSLRKQGQNVTALGWSEYDIDRMLAEGDKNPNVEFKEYDEAIAETVEYHACPNCGHRWPK